MQTAVIIGVWHGPEPVLNALKSLSRLPEHDQLEVVIANCSGPDTERLIVDQYPGVSVLTLAPRSSIAEARHAAIQKTSAEIIAVLHERYEIPANWIRMIRQAHAAHTAEVIGGCVGPQPRMTSAQWAMFMSEYLHATTRLPSGPLDRAGALMIPGGNVSYKRSVFREWAMSGYMWELDYHAALFDRGVSFYRDNEIVAIYGAPGKTSDYLAERRQISRQYASRRATAMSPLPRLALGVSRMLLPLVVIGRAGARVVCWNPNYFPRLIQALPWMLVFSTVQGCSEFAGSLSKQPHAGFTTY